MATNKTPKTPAVKTTARRTLMDLPVSTITPPTDANKQAIADTASADRTLVNVPKDYTLTLDDGSPVKIHAGVQMMPTKLATHWFSKAQGVAAYDPEAAASVKA